MAAIHDESAQSGSVHNNGDGSRGSDGSDRIEQCCAVSIGGVV